MLTPGMSMGCRGISDRVRRVEGEEEPLEVVESSNIGIPRSVGDGGRGTAAAVAFV